MSPRDAEEDVQKSAAQKRAERAARFKPEAAAPAGGRAAPAASKTHVVAADETLSHLSLKYYGSAAKPYWMVIYDANKGTIGDNPNRIRAGMELVIPELPADLKKD